MQFLFVILGREFERKTVDVETRVRQLKGQVQCFSMQELQVVMNK